MAFYSNLPLTQRVYMALTRWQRKKLGIPADAVPTGRTVASIVRFVSLQKLTESVHTVVPRVVKAKNAPSLRMLLAHHGELQLRLPLLELELHLEAHRDQGVPVQAAHVPRKRERGLVVWCGSFTALPVRDCAECNSSLHVVFCAHGTLPVPVQKDRNTRVVV